MKYISTRGQANQLNFQDVLLSGLARDGGLYVPQQWPEISFNELESFVGLSYHQIAIRVILEKKLNRAGGLMVVASM